MTLRRPSIASAIRQDSGWIANYIRCMRKVWSHPDNDQRAAVLEWLPPLVPAASVIVDIGAGDGYYATTLRPRRYLFVEPLSELSKHCGENLEGANVETKGFRTVTDLFESGRWESADIVLVVHAVFYLTPSELEIVASIASGRPCAMVYPDPDQSAAVAFEDATGCGRSRGTVAHKARLFGKPTSRQVAHTHLGFRPGTRARDIEFVLSHLQLREPGAEGVAKAALSHVRDRRTAWWQGAAGWEVPQAQIMEYWSKVGDRGRRRASSRPSNSASRALAEE